MASAFLVTLPASATAKVLKDGYDSILVYADDAADAKAMAKAVTDGDADAQWDGATTTALVAAANLVGWRFRVVIFDSDPVVDVEVVGAGTDDTIDEIAALLVIALNATAPIAGAAYNSTSQVLTIAETTDSLGDKKVAVEVYPPASVGGRIPIPGFVDSVTDEGSAGAALSCTFAADAYPVPSIPIKVRA